MPKSTGVAGCSAANGAFSRRPVRSPRCRRPALEVAFAGRSNVGKSSLINALTGRRSLARTSNTPGRTQELIFLRRARRLMLVDLPGYGYAAAAKSKVAAWTKLIHAYLNGRADAGAGSMCWSMRGTVLRMPTTTILDTLGQAAVSYEIVLTKCDQVSDAELAERRQTVQAAVRKRAAAFPDILATSARNGAGIAGAARGRRAAGRRALLTGFDSVLSPEAGAR